MSFLAGLPSSATTAILAKLSPAGTGLPAGVLHTGCTADWNVDGTCVAVASAVRPVQVFNSDGELLDQISTKAQRSARERARLWQVV